MEVIEKNKKVAPAPTDTTKKSRKNKKESSAPTDNHLADKNINVNNSIPQIKENDDKNLNKNIFVNNCQNNADNLDREINYEKLAYENLKDNPIFQQLPEVAKQARIKNEINKIKILELYS